MGTTKTAICCSFPLCFSSFATREGNHSHTDDLIKGPIHRRAPNSAFYDEALRLSFPRRSTSARCGGHAHPITQSVRCHPHRLLAVRRCSTTSAATILPCPTLPSCKAFPSRDSRAPVLSTRQDLPFGCAPPAHNMGPRIAVGAWHLVTASATMARRCHASHSRRVLPKQCRYCLRSVSARSLKSRGNIHIDRRAAGGRIPSQSTNRFTIGSLSAFLSQLPPSLLLRCFAFVPHLKPPYTLTMLSGSILNAGCPL